MNWRTVIALVFTSPIRHLLPVAARAVLDQ